MHGFWSLLHSNKFMFVHVEGSFGIRLDNASLTLLKKFFTSLSLQGAAEE